MARRQPLRGRVCDHGVVAATHLALLRGINVGGRNLVRMPDLRQVFVDIGHADVTTYIQSGNVLFAPTTTDTRAVARALEQEIAARLSVKPAVVVISGKTLHDVIAKNPFAAESDPKRVHVIFRGDPAPADLASELAAVEQWARDRGSRDEAKLVGDMVYLRTPDGMGRSELAAGLERRASTRALGTARNWATVLRLDKLLNATS